MRKIYKTLTVLFVLLFSISTVNAKTLTERLADGHKLRLGFGTAVPWAYAGDNGEALGCKHDSFNCFRGNGDY